MPIDIAGPNTTAFLAQVESLSAKIDEQVQNLATYRAEVNGAIAKLASETGGLERQVADLTFNAAELRGLLTTAAYYLERYARSVPSESANWAAVTKLLMRVHEATP